MKAPLVIAHRGASAYRPENTMIAYALAVEQRADMLEIDLHLTKDGEIVIIHDATLAHVGGVGEVADHTLAEIRELDAGGGERIPTLDEVLDAFGRTLAINLEIKRGTRDAYPGIERAALAAVAQRGLLDSILFSSFFDPVLENLRELSEEARIAVLVAPLSPGDPLERAARFRAEAVNPDRRLALALAPAILGAGLAMYPYTVDSEDEMAAMIQAGAAGLFTNFPDRMRSLVDRERP